MRNKLTFNIFLLLVLLQLYSCTDTSTGKRLYTNRCASCHGTNGEGMRKLIPPLAHADFISKNNEQLSCIIRNGMKDTIIVNGFSYHQPMPGNTDLSETDISNIINYMNKQWYPDESFRHPEKIRELLEKCR